MYNLSSICFMCLRDNKSLKQLFHKNVEFNTFKEVLYILPEYVSLEPTTAFKICSTCYAAVSSFYTLKKMWLENYSLLRKQIQSLQDTGDIQIDGHIKKIGDPLVEEQKNQTEEYISSGDESDSQSIEFVKCGVADKLQNGSISDKFKVYESLNWIRIGTKEFKCLLCNRIFTTKKSVEYHINCHNAVSNIECKVCNTKFMRKTHLKEHMKLHVEIKDTECSICNRKFKHNYHLKVHFKTHNKDIKCSICNKKFMTTYQLKKHLKMHECVKNFECAICNKKFVLKSILIRHIKSHAGIKD